MISLQMGKVFNLFNDLLKLFYYTKYMRALFLIFSFFALFSLPLQANQQQLKVAMFIEPPYVEFVNEQWVGDNIDIINLVTQDLNISIDYIHCPFARCLTMVKNGQADMMMSLLKSAKREEDLIFIEPPYLMQHHPLRFFTLNSRQLTINQLNDLEGLLVGTIRGGAYFKEFDENKAIKKVAVTSHEQLINMLLKGHIDTVVEREESIKPLISSQDFQQKVSLAKYQYNQPVGSYIVFSKKSTKQELAQLISERLNAAIQKGIINPNRQ